MLVRVVSVRATARSRFYWHGTLIGNAILATVAVRINSYSIPVAGVVRISIALRIRISAIVVAVRIGTSVAAVVAVIAVTAVGIAGTAAVTSCGESRNQHSAKGHRYSSIVDRFISLPYNSRRVLYGRSGFGRCLSPRSVLPRLLDQCRRRRNAVRGIGRSRQFGRASRRSFRSIPGDSR